MEGDVEGGVEGVVECEVETWLGEQDGANGLTAGGGGLEASADEDDWV